MPEVKSHLSDITTDPLRNFKFLVEIAPPGALRNSNTGQEFLRMGFMSVSGLNATNEVIPYREGGMNTSARKLPGQTNFSDITLTRGVVYGPAPLWEWFRLIFYAGQGQGLRVQDNDFRAPNMQIHVLGHPENPPNSAPKATFYVARVWPTSLAFSDLDAGGNTVFVQQLVVTHEGWTFNIADNIAQDSSQGFVPGF